MQRNGGVLKDLVTCRGPTTTQMSGTRNRVGEIWTRCSVKARIPFVFPAKEVARKRSCNRVIPFAHVSLHDRPST